jgi:cytochrome c553
MKRKPLFLLSALLIGLATSGCANLERSRDLANADVPAQVMAEQVCSICHGLDGNSTSPAYPQLAGQQATYLSNQLNNFRGHGRSDPAGSEYMWGISHRLTDAQIAGLADYYSKQKARRPDGSTEDQKLLAAGREIFEKGVPEQNVIQCNACHGPKGQGIEAFPQLAYQHSDYLLKQLNIFQNTQGRPGTPMDAVVHPLTGENKRAVAAYLQAFPD